MPIQAYEFKNQLCETEIRQLETMFNKKFITQQLEGRVWKVYMQTMRK